MSARYAAMVTIKLPSNIEMVAEAREYMRDYIVPMTPADALTDLRSLDEQGNVSDSLDISERLHQSGVSKHLP